MKIKCLIVDDEPIALQLLEKYILQTPFLELTAKASNALNALEILEQKNDIQLLFLDIQMPELSGIELSKILPKHMRVIFTTAFEQYALESFKLNALDYLLKPFSYSEFLQAANKAKYLFNLLEMAENQANQNIENIKNDDYIFVKSEYKQIKIPLNDILYVEGLKDYAKIYLKKQQNPILTLNSLKKIESELPSDNFMRVHRSYIIALNKIEEIERSQVIINNVRISIAPQYKEDFDKFIERNSL